MRFEVNLAAQIGHVESAHVMTYESDWDNQWDQSVTVVLDHRGQFVAGILAEPIAKVACHVLQHVDLTRGRGDLLERVHEFGFVAIAQFSAREGSGPRDHPSERRIS